MDSNPKTKKILIVCPSFHLGGIERSLSNLANFFVTQGIDVVFVSLLAGTAFFKLDQHIKVVSPRFRRNGNLFKLILYRLRLIFFLRKQIKESKPDVILSLSDTFNAIAILANIRLGIRIFIGDVTKPDRKFKYSTVLAKKYLYPLCTGFVAQTQQAARYYQQKFNQKLNIRVINGAVKEMKLHPDIVRQQLIIVVGRLAYEKGQDRMIDIFERIKEKNGWTLAFTADGPIRSKLEELIVAKELSNQVKLLGQVDDLDKLYATASIFAMPSRMEGFPNALCEAMAAGLPCIAFNSFPVDEIIVDGVDGYIVQDGNIDAFAAILEQLMNNPKERQDIGQRAKAISNRLSIETIGNNFLEFFNS